MRVTRWITVVAPLVLLIAFVCGAPPVSWGDEAADLEFFERKIRPVLVEKCYQCHSVLSKEVKGNLLLDHREGLRNGGESGPAVVPGKPDESALLSALRHETWQMPPDERLPDAVVRDFQQWIERGAPDPRDKPATPAAATQAATAERFAQLKKWWSLQPVQSPASPAVANNAWPTGAIDSFILQRLEAEQLTPSARASKQVLLRRLSYALRGLPPSAEEATTLLGDASSERWPQLVDRWLASPAFGEHFARHWMDVVRYGDTYGYEWDVPAKGAWRYRDYLVRAFNADVPIDQLFREQIAGDLLAEPRINALDQVNESRLGTIFYQLGEKRHGDSSEFDGIHQEMLDNKIDAFSKTFLALTVACARCHDHKIDAVRQTEYYALGGAFMSSRWLTNTVDLPARHAAAVRELQAIKQALRATVADQWQAAVNSLTAEHLTNVTKATAGTDALEHLLHPWQTMQAANGGYDMAARWNSLGEEYRLQSQQRAEKNKAEFTLVADFRQGVPAGWSIDGVGLREATPCGDFTMSLEGESIVGQVLLGGLVTNATSPRFNGAVRTPYLNTIEPGHLSFEVSGGEFAARRGVIDNAFLTEKQQYVASPLPQWQLADTFGGMRNRRNYLEFATKTSNPNFPPRVGLGGDVSEQQIADPRSWFALSRVVRHQVPHTPLDELTRFAKLFATEPITTVDEALLRYRAILLGSIASWKDNHASDDDVRLLNAALTCGLLPNTAASDSPAALLRDRYRALEKELPTPWTANGMADLDPGYNLPLNERGEYDQPGGIVPRGSLSVLADVPGFTAPGSGRLQLAEQIASNSNPLTARVFVNRVWQWLFGAGLVATSNDFGHLGARPSHPELLDHLTTRFMREGWSVKRLVREILLSKTWQQQSTPSTAAEQADPSNRLLSHFELRRLTAEELRDSILTASGRFDPQLYGAPTNPQRSSEDAQKRLFSGPVDGGGRRSLYTKVTLMEPPRFLAVFNQPPPKISTGVRDVTSTPAQPLALLNDPFTNELAQFMAEQLIRTGGAEDSPARLRRMFLATFSRMPTDAEIDRWSAVVSEIGKEKNLIAADQASSISQWKEIAHAMFNTKEFIYMR